MRYFDMAGAGCKAWFPNEVTYVFSPQIVRVENNNKTFSATLTITGGVETFSLTRETTDGLIVFDARRYLQIAFSNTDLSRTTAGTEAVTESRLGIPFSLSLYITNTANTGGTVTNTQNMLGVWGAMDAGEGIPEASAIPVYTGLPFTFGLVGPPNFVLRATYSDGTSTVYINGGTPDSKLHLYNVTPALAFTSGKQIVKIETLSPVPVIEKDVLTTSFRTWRAESSACTEGTYLRWVDRRGEYRYWLFHRQTATSAITVASSFDRSGSWPSAYYHNHVDDASPLRQVFGCVDTLLLAAPNVERWALDYLHDLGLSPVVDLYTGSGDWLRVNVVAQSRTIGSADRQDYTITIQFPKKYAQEP